MERSTCVSAAKLTTAEGRYSASRRSTSARSPILPCTKTWSGLSETDARVRRLGSTLRFSYDEPTRIAWEQEDGDLKSVEGSWMLDDLGGGRTLATYSMTVDLGRMLGMVIRGPLVGVLRGQLVESMPGKLKEFVER